MLWGINPYLFDARVIKKLLQWAKSDQLVPQATHQGLMVNLVAIAGKESHLVCDDGRQRFRRIHTSLAHPLRESVSCIKE
jgi:hypothetical protein